MFVYEYSCFCMSACACLCVSLPAQLFICAAAVGIFERSLACVCVCFFFLCNIFVWRFWRFFQHIVYYAKRKMQYFLLCRYVADKNIYNLAASASLFTPALFSSAGAFSPWPQLQKPANSCSSCPDCKKAEAIKGSAIEANRASATGSGQQPWGSSHGAAVAGRRDQAAGSGSRRTP